VSDYLIDYTLHLADNALILGHRNSEWCGHGPVLEQDIAISNISLDLIGQARNFYQYAATLINSSTSHPVDTATEDTLAYLRDPHEFRNCLLAELPKGDWAITILRQFFFSGYQYLLYGQLKNSKDEQLAAIAAKALKEVTYHVRWSSEWVIRLGDGTEESRTRITTAIDELWPYTNELFRVSGFELRAGEKGTGADIASLKPGWDARVSEVFSEAGLTIPATVKTISEGKEGKHTKHLEQLLSEMQYMQRTYPNSTW
jgi:ring-1,2-phenylacetyl-CoA epoxidase subunit PaaC